MGTGLGDRAVGFHCTRLGGSIVQGWRFIVLDSRLS